MSMLHPLWEKHANLYIIFYPCKIQSKIIAYTSTKKPIYGSLSILGRPRLASSTL